MEKDFIESIILRMCSKPRSFDHISSNLYGLDPILIKEYLTELIQKGKIEHLNDLWVIKGFNDKKKFIKTLNETQHNDYLKKHIPYFDLFKKPHPLDFEWRNSSKTLDYLNDLLVSLNSANEKILLLGMPSLFVSSYMKNLPQKITLVDKNRPLLNSIKKLINQSNGHTSINEDIFTLNPGTIGKHDTVFIDPPWYSEHFYQFIWFASQCLKVGGVLGISIPPVNTRPGIGKERMEWFNYCQDQGLFLDGLLSQKLEYVMPFFEFNAFRAAGIKDTFPFWRKGDFALFRKMEERESTRPKLTLFINNWIEKDMDSVSFRIKKDKITSKSKVLSIEHVIKGDILPSVSSRDKRRDEVNIWTSGNRVFRVNNPQLFSDQLDVYKKSKGHLPKQFKIVGDFLNIVIDLESKEYNNYLDWLYYEMERQNL
jgi:hypothetical protein